MTLISPERRYILLLIGTFFSLSVSAQTIVQWAARVVDYSSELSELQHSARQATGKPNILPSGGDNPNAWSPFNNNTQEFIKLQFDLPMPIVQIAIGETYNPGSVKEVFTYDENGKEYSVYKADPGPIDEPYRMLRIMIPPTPYNVTAIKIEIDGKSVEGFASIDCVGISNSDAPIEAKINHIANINTKLLVNRLNEKVNSPYRENKPLLTKDRKTLYFSRRGHPDNVGGEDDLEDIWISDIDSKTLDWGEARNVGEPLNNTDPNFISSFLLDKEELIILGNEYLQGGMKYGISTSLRTSDSTWSKPENLRIFNDKNEHENVNFWLTPDSEILIISEEGRGTEGYRDLYVSFLQKNGLWTEPLHMGGIINTAGEEESPYLMPDKKTLFFSSNGHSGYGKRDLFMTRRLDNSWQSWTEPENLGPVINSPEDEKFLFLPLDGGYGYFCRHIDGYSLDIHTFTLPLVTEQLRIVSLCGQITDPDTQQPLDAEVVFSRLRDAVEVGRVRTDEGGNYCIELPADEIYSYRAEIPGFIPVGTTVDLLDVSDLNVFAVSLDRLDLDSVDLKQGHQLEIPEDVMKAVAITLAMPTLKRDTIQIVNSQRKELAFPGFDSEINVSGVKSPDLKPVNSNAIIQEGATPQVNVKAKMVRALPGTSFIIRNVFFDFDKDILKPKSWVEIKNLAKFMNDYPDAIVELAGHTDNYGTPEYNIDLSERRVKAVRAALATLGIKEERLQFVWYGEEVPIASNRNRFGRALNRRVEFTIVSM